MNFHNKSYRKQLDLNINFAVLVNGKEYYIHNLAFSFINHWKITWSHFTGGTIILLGIPSNWRIFVSNWLDIFSQFDFQSRGRILVPPVIQPFRLKWLHFSFSDTKLHFTHKLMEAMSRNGGKGFITPLLILSWLAHKFKTQRSLL